ncbi:MAG: 2'-5' RNA ligase family protein [Chloroflexi bacterium]|nr:2'-5' RNA ligase family protein [Chloroflexota bacterium]
MGYAVEFYFDSQTEKSVLNLRHILAEQGISSTLGNLKDRPHISLAVFSDVDCDNLIELTKVFSNHSEPFNFQLGAISTFLTDENVLYLSPIPTRQLLDCHLRFHTQLEKDKLIPSKYYLPTNWMPHCTVEMNIPNEQFARAVEICKKTFSPLHGSFQEIGVVKFRPIKKLAVCTLGK